MDITYDFNKNKRFNYRVAAIITQDHHILLQSTSKIDFWLLPGGRCKHGEDSRRATGRELYEELGIDFSELKLTFIVESFFKYDEKDFHEMSHIYRSRNSRRLLFC